MSRVPGLQVRLRVRLGASLVEAVAELAYVHFAIGRVKGSDVGDAGVLVESSWHRTTNVHLQLTWCDHTAQGVEEHLGLAREQSLAPNQSVT